MKRLVFLAIILSTCVVFATGAHAEIMYKALPEPDPEGGFTGPTPTVCYAQKSTKQQCRLCADQYDPFSGQPAGKVCAFSDTSAACTCDAQKGCTKDIGRCYYMV